jgi:hypothetical protein
LDPEEAMDLMDGDQKSGSRYGSTSFTDSAFHSLRLGFYSRIEEPPETKCDRRREKSPRTEEL